MAADPATTERQDHAVTESSTAADRRPVRVTVWGENRHEQVEEHVARIYPRGMHGAVAEGIEENLGDGVVVRTATLDDPDHGLTEQVLAGTDVLTWWGHAATPRSATRWSSGCTGTCCRGWG